MFQMRFYALVWWRLFDHIPEQLRLMYLKVHDDMVLSPTPAELNYVEKDLARTWEAIGDNARTGNFAPKTSKLCGWCSFQKICPAFGGTPPEYPGVPPEFA
jgi:putative RecB family exonuclease